MRFFRNLWYRIDWRVVRLLVAAAAILAALVLLPPMLGWDDTKVELQILIGVILFLFLVVLSYRRR